MATKSKIDIVRKDQKDQKDQKNPDKDPSSSEKYVRSIPIEVTQGSTLGGMGGSAPQVCLDGPAEVYKMVDRKDDMFISCDPWPNMPVRALIIGKSQRSGKTSRLGQILLHDESPYKRWINPEYVFVVCGSAQADEKWKTIISELEIPEENVVEKYDEQWVMARYEDVASRYNDDIEAGRTPDYSWFIFDDVAFDGSLKSKQNGAIDKLFCNGRHYLINTFLLAQKYTQIDTTCRANMTAGWFFELPYNEVELLYKDIGHMNKKTFIDVFTKATMIPHSCFVYNANSNRAGADMYLNQHMGNLLVGGGTPPRPPSS